MSIASNVLLENTRLGTTRTKVRNKLTEYGIWWDDSLSLFDLVRRLVLMWVRIVSTTKSDIVPPGGFVYSVTLEDEGIPVDWWLNGTHSVGVTNTNGVSSLTVPYVDGSTGNIICKVGRKVAFDVNYQCVPFVSFYNSVWDYDFDLYDVVKYPSDISHTFYLDDAGEDFAYDLTKAIQAASVVMVIPHVYQNGIDGTNGIHISASIYQKKDSNQGWGDCIALVNSKSLSHYRDTKILELGAYPGGKGVKYSTSDHVVRDLNVTTGQLTLDSQRYSFDLYFDNGYVKATIKSGSTTVFSYEGDASDKITFDTFYPAIMIYEAGGHIQFESVNIQPWTHEVENNE